VLCRVLGSVEIEIEGSVVDLGGPTPRRLVSALSTATGAPISDDVLAEMVWGGVPPANIANTLRVAVSRLRDAFGADGRHYLERAQAGYLLAVPLDRTDHGQFTVLVDEGSRKLTDGHPDRAIDTLESALALWRGQPWPELGESLAASGARTRLIEHREVAVEELQAARLACGDTARAVAALSEAVTEAPYRERRWELLALGLYRSGRQGHALAELRRARNLFIDELGVDPGPTLSTLERRILEHDPDLLLVETPAGRVSAGTASPTPLRINQPLALLIGRRRELETLDELLATRRLVTIVGPAGVGKTRLALEHAASRPDAWLVRLADVHSADVIASTVASAIGLSQVVGDTELAIRRAVADRSAVLVLDNCEHLVAAVAAFALSLLSHCPQVRILATSRQSINVDGDCVLPLQPLSVVGPYGENGSAVALLFDRVRANRSGWQPTPEDEVSAREICAAVDGLPLAIELAAARERAFGLAGIASHLRDRLDVLGTTPRGSISPHSSLDAAIGWSIDQLADVDRALLLRLWPFEDGFTWQAAGAVQRPGADIAVLAILASLVDRSVLTADVSSGTARYRMLETVRRYCRDADPDQAVTQQAHADWVRTLVADQASLFSGPRFGDAIRTLAAELANIRAGVEHDPENATAMAVGSVSGGLVYMWVAMGAISEGTRVVKRALETCPDEDFEGRALGSIVLSLHSCHTGQPAEALKLADAALDLLDEADPAHNVLVLEAHLRRCHALADLNDMHALRVATEQFKFETDRRGAPDYLRVTASWGIGIVQFRDGKVAEATETFATAHEISRRSGFGWGQGITDLHLASCLASGTEPDAASIHRALGLLSRAVDAFEREPAVSDELAALYLGACLLAKLGLSDVAVRLHTSVVGHAERIGTEPRRYSAVAGPGLEDCMNRLLAANGAATEVLSWPAMVALFTGAAAQLSIVPAGAGVSMRSR